MTSCGSPPVTTLTIGADAERDDEHQQRPGAAPEQGRHERDEHAPPRASATGRSVRSAASSTATSGEHGATSTQSRQTRRGGGGDAAGASHSERRGLVMPS